MSDAVAPTRQSPVIAAVARGAQATGMPFELLLATAQRESSLNPSARAATSSATGLFQFIDGTWLSMVQRHGAEHGLGRYAAAIETRDGRPFVRDPAMRQEILSLRHDAELSARMAGELLQENAQFLENQLGRPATPGELYAAHVMGPAGAARLIEAASQGAPSAAAIFPREAAANRALFYFPDGTVRSAAQLLQRLDINPSAAPLPQSAVSVAPMPSAPPSPPPRAPGLIAPETTNALLTLVTDWPSAARILRDDEQDV
jgi:Transglycosylase SLT domain